MPLKEYVVYWDDEIILFYGHTKEQAFLAATTERQTKAKSPDNLTWHGCYKGGINWEYN